MSSFHNKHGCVMPQQATLSLKIGKKNILTLNNSKASKNYEIVVHSKNVA